MKKFTQHFFASCSVGMEELLLKEIMNQGITLASTARGGVHFETANDEWQDVIIWSRIASRVYRKLFQIKVSDEKEFYDKIKLMPWHKFLQQNQTFSFKSIFSHSKKRQVYFRNSHYTSLLAKDALVDKYREETNRRPNVSIDNPDFNFLLHFSPEKEKDKVTILLDLCGTPLSHRGYRNDTFEAPLRENLAAALILMTGWNPENEILVDGMCGSGTFLLEASMIAANIPPSILRFTERIYPWAFLGHGLFLSFNEKRNWEYRSQIIQKEFVPRVKSLKEKNLLYGCDLSFDAIEMTKRYFKNLYGNKYSPFLTCKNFLSYEMPEGKGVIVINPPYGERLDSDEFNKFHEDILNKAKNSADKKAYLLMPTESPLQIKSFKKIPVKNGNINCDWILC